MQTKVSTKGQVVLPSPIRGDWDFAPAIRSTSAVCKRGNLAQAEQTLIWSDDCQAQQFCKRTSAVTSVRPSSFVLAAQKRSGDRVRYSQLLGGEHEFHGSPALQQMSRRPRQPDRDILAKALRVPH